MTLEPTAQESLLADTRWLQGLLERLVGDAHVAEDLHQETLLAAWARGPEGAVTRSWLSKVARNLAVSFRRGSTRRSRAESGLPGCSHSSTPPELIIEAELASRAVEAVLALHEPYRTTVLLRYMKGRSPAEVAQEMSVPTETVRTRQRRALEILRQKLGVRERRLVFVPMAWPGWVKVTAVMTMSKKGALAVVSVVALLAIGWLVVPPPVAPSPPTAPAPVLALAPVALGLDTVETEAEIAAPVVKRSVVPTPETGALEVHLTWKGTGEVAVGISLRLASRIYDPGMASISDSSGIIRFEELEPGAYTLSGIWLDDLKDRCTIEVAETQRREYSLDQGLRGTVTVVGSRGMPVADALVVGRARRLPSGLALPSRPHRPAGSVRVPWHEFRESLGRGFRDPRHLAFPAARWGSAGGRQHATLDPDPARHRRLGFGPRVTT